MKKKSSKKKVIKAAMVTTRDRAKKVLKELVEVLNIGDQDAKELWNIVSALRGPDMPNTRTLKYLTTSRLRDVLGMSSGVGLEINHTPLTIEYKVDRQAEMTQKATSHFENHFVNAVEAVRSLYGYDLFEEKNVDKPLGASKTVSYDMDPKGNITKTVK